MRNSAQLRDHIIVTYRRAIWWVTRDFRVDDNLALSLAVNSSLQILAVVLPDPILRAHPEYSAFHHEMLRQGTDSLRRDLAERGGNVVVISGPTVESLSRIRAIFPFEAIFAEQQQTRHLHWEQEQLVRSWCLRQGIQLYPVSSGVDSDATWKQWAHSSIIPTPERMVSPPASVFAPWSSWPTGGEWHLPRAEELRPARLSRGAADALLRLVMVPSGEASRSQLSAAFSWGVLSPRTMFQRIESQMRRERTSATREDLNRWRALLSRLHRKARSVWEPLPSLVAMPCAEEETESSIERRWIRGETGFPILDAIMRCLAVTGDAPFALRAFAAMSAIHVLQIPANRVSIQLARRFADFDPYVHAAQIAVRTGITRSISRLLLSPERALIELDPRGDFVKRWIPEAKKYHVTEIALHAHRPLVGLPKPVCSWEHRVWEAGGAAVDSRTLQGQSILF